MNVPRLKLGLAAMPAATVYLLACVLPSEPSDAGRIGFRLDFQFPYRVPLAGSGEPVIAIVADGRVLQNASYRLESLDPDLVGVDASGRRLEGVGRGPGAVRVVYTTAVGAVDTVFTVQVVVSRVAVGPSATSLTNLGATAQLSATAYDATDATVPNVAFTWSSADPGVVAVNDAGVARAVDEGAVAITAEADSVKGGASITVTQVAAQVRLAPELDTLRTVGRSAQFIAIAFDDTGGILRTAKPRWASSDPMVASVDGAGLATATGAGTARIVARVGEAADTGTLVVAQVIRFIVVTPGYDTLTAIADTGRIAALAFDSLNFPIPSPSVVWATSDAAVATVDQAGLVQAAKNGVVLVTASAAGQAASATVLVRQEVARAQISPDNVALTGAGATVQLSAVGLDRNGYPVPGAGFTWRSGSQCIATVDAGLVTARGGGETAVTATPLNGGQPGTATVSVTGAPSSQPQIAYAAVTSLGSGGINSLCDLDGQPTVLIPNTSDYTVQSPAWSPDGASLAFVRSDLGSCPRIYIARADGSDARRVTDGCDVDPAWSPDGARIAFSRFGPPTAIYIANADGSNVQRLWGDNYDWYHPTWSPDGTRLAFARVTGDATAVVDADGTGFNVILHGNPFNGYYGPRHPAWSPDGSQLALDDTYNLVLINSDGSGAAVLVSGGREVTPDGCISEADNWSPAWSPDGAQIVFAGLRDVWCYDSGAGSGSQTLFVINRDGTGLRELSGTSSPGWLPLDAPTWRRFPALAPPSVPAAARTRLRSEP